MDPEDLPAFLDRIYTTDESRVDLLRLVFPQDVITEATLDDHGIVKELAKVRESVVKPFIGTPAPAPAWGPFVLL